MSEKRKKVYISGAISGYDLDERIRTFQDVEDKLRAYGFDVVNPLKNGLPHDASTHEHMKRDFELLLQCDGIFLMDRWLHSAGCKVEFDVATACGMEVNFIGHDGTIYRYQ